MENVLQFGMCVLSTRLDEKTSKILVQLGDDRGAADTDNAEWVQSVGLASLPSKVSPGKASCQVVSMQGGDRDVCIGSQDLRGLELYGNLKPGETCLYGAGELGLSQGRAIIKTDGSLNLFTTDTNTRDGKSIYLRIGTGTDANGLPDGLSFVAPWGTLKFDSAGFRVTHKSGASLELGGILGIPPPLDVISSYLSVTAGAIIGKCSAASFGVTAQQPVAQAVPTQAALIALQAQIAAQQVQIAALQTEIDAVAGALVSVAGITGPVAVAHATAAAVGTAAVVVGAAAVTTGAAAVTAGTSAVSAASLLMPAVTSSS